MNIQGVVTSVPFVTPTGEYELPSLEHKDIVFHTLNNGWHRLMLYLSLGTSIGVYEDDTHRFTLKAGSAQELAQQVQLACELFCSGGFHARVLVEPEPIMLSL